MLRLIVCIALTTLISAQKTCANEDGKKAAPIKNEPSVKPTRKAPATAKKTTARGKAKKESRPKDESVLADQRKNADAAREKLGVILAADESEEFILYTDMPGETGPLLKALQDAFTWLSRDVFELAPEDELWEGKCIVFVFTSRKTYERFCTEIAELPDLTKAQAFFARRGGRVVIAGAMPDVRDAKPVMGSVLVHELTHAFLEYYRTTGNAKVWLHEGLAQFMEIRGYPELGLGRSQAEIIRGQLRIGNLPMLSEIFVFQSIRGDDHKSYALAWSVVDFMIRIDARKFARFVDEVKTGKTEEEAIGTAYRMPMKRFEAMWREHAARM
ncbi:MAG TPA: DUF1570 domain-containing protein [Candidatus Brocadiia bacterium]|nr:DUF1570 domain-containing protein [Candidatus Brocadiia bacterium]